MANSNGDNSRYNLKPYIAGMWSEMRLDVSDDGGGLDVIKLSGCRIGWLVMICKLYYESCSGFTTWKTLDVTLQLKYCSESWMKYISGILRSRRSFLYRVWSHRINTSLLSFLYRPTHHNISDDGNNLNSDYPNPTLLTRLKPYSS